MVKAQRLRKEGRFVSLRKRRRACNMRYLTIALTKGRLAQKTLDIFEKVEITCEEIRDKNSRKLILSMKS